MGRIIVVFVALLLMGQSVSAQSDQSVAKLNEEARELYLAYRYSEAEELYNKAIKIQVSEGHKLINDDYKKSLNGVAKIYFIIGDFHKADSIYNSLLQFSIENYGDKSLEYAAILTSIGGIRIEQQQLSGLYEILKPALDIRGATLGENHPDYAATLDKIGMYYTYGGVFDKGMESLNKAAEIIKAALGEDTPEYANAMLQIGNVYLFKQDFANAEKYYLKGLEISKEHPDELNINYVQGLLRLGTLYGYKSQFREGLNITLQALPFVEKIYGKESLEYAATISNVGAMYATLGDYDKAEPILKESMQRSKRIVGEKHSYYFNALNTLAMVYKYRGLYEKSESLHIESLELRRAMYDESHPSVVAGISNLAVFYIELGNYAMAEKLILEALAKTESTLGKKSHSYATLLTNLSLIYKKRGDYATAMSLLEKAADTFDQSGDKKNIIYLNILTGMCNILMDNKDQKSADVEKLLLEVLEKWKQITGEDHYSYTIALNNLATYYDRHGEHEKSKGLYRKALDFYEKPENRNNKNGLRAFFNAGKNMEFLDNLVEARSYYDEFIEITKRFVEDNFAFLSEKERELYWNSIKGLLQYLIAFSDDYKNIDPSQTSLAYNCELLSKNLLLNSSQQIRSAILNSEDTELIELWQRMSDLKKNPQKYRSEINSLDKELTTKSNLYRELQSIFNIQWEDVKKALGKDEIAIEFVNFDNSDSEDGNKRKIQYSALLINSESIYPEMISLGEESVIQAALQQANSEGNQLYSILWKPIEAYLKDVKTIYISPSGLLNSISFAGIRNGNNYLIDKYFIYNLLSTKDVIGLKSLDNKVNRDIVLFGGADFSLSTSVLAQVDDGLTKSTSLNLTRGMLDKLDKDRGQGFDYLPGSKEEVLSIDKMLSSLGWTSTVFTDKDATETRLKAISSNSPEILHISTHGFYFPQLQQETDPLNFVESKNVFKVSDNPLMRSGLLFSGANSVWNGNEPEEDVDDGILTAYEISNLNLSNTKLVILSACNTGLGDIDYSEGIYGLQRAFRLAGVKSLVVSLWNVPDKETSEMMIELYKHLSNGIDVKKAFSRSQQKMRKSYPDNPEKWAGFMLVQ